MDRLQENWAPLWGTVDGLVEDLKIVLPKPFHETFLSFTIRSCLQNVMRLRAEDFVFKGASQEYRDADAEDAATVLTYCSSYADSMAIGSQVDGAYDYVAELAKVYSPENVDHDAIMLAMFDDLPEDERLQEIEDLELRNKALDAQAERLHANIQDTLHTQKSECIAAAKSAISRASHVGDYVSLIGCKPWIIKMLLNNVFSCIYGNEGIPKRRGFDKDGNPVYGPIWTGALGKLTAKGRKGDSSVYGKISDITNHRFKVRIAKAIIEYEVLYAEWRFEIQNEMDRCDNAAIGENEHVDIDASRDMDGRPTTNAYASIIDKMSK